jgi:hypothetical protein
MMFGRSCFVGLVDNRFFRIVSDEGHMENSLESIRYDTLKFAAMLLAGSSEEFG